MNASPKIPITSPSYFSRRKFLNLSGLALASGALAGISRTWATSPKTMTTQLPETEDVFKVEPLPYAYDALQPIIDTETMHLHYDKHYAAYTKNLNAALREAPELKSQSITGLLSDIPSLPHSVRETIRNNGGGYYNHGLFWQWMAPDGGGTPTGNVGTAINKAFKSFGHMQEKFTTEAISIFGSGWAWLIVCNDGSLAITSTPNQDNPIMKGVAEPYGKPILGLDVWEHSYYLKYKNERQKYIEGWWKVVNWKTVNSLYQAALS